MTLSNVFEVKLKFFALANSTEAFSCFCDSILEWALGVQPGQISIPTTYPFTPVFSAAGKREDPVPHPTSKTLMPGVIAA